jgi:hypothetical protein
MRSRIAAVPATASMKGFSSSQEGWEGQGRALRSLSRRHQRMPATKAVKALRRTASNFLIRLPL